MPFRFKGFGPCIGLGSTKGRLAGGIYAGADETAVGIDLEWLAVVNRFTTISVAFVVCGSATAGFATVGGCGPTEVLGFKLALSGRIRFGTTVGG